MHGVGIVYIEGSKVSNLCTTSKREYVSNQRERYRYINKPYSAIGWFATRHISILCEREYWMSAPRWGNHPRSVVPK